LGPAAAGLDISGNGTVTNTLIAGNSITGTRRSLGAGGLLARISGGGQPGTLTLADNVVDGNSGDVGGVWLQSGLGATLNVTKTSITNNAGGSIGGGLYYDWNSYGLTLTDTTIDGNSAVGAAPAGLGLFGGARVSGVTISGNTGQGVAIKNSTPAELTNVTVSGNGAGMDVNTYGFGGAITVRVTNLTVAFNGAPGLSYTSGGGRLQLRNTIVANNTGTNCGGTVPSDGNNLEGNDPGVVGTGSGNSCGFAAPGDLANRAPLLGPLADNGGLTFTHALLSGSPAIDGVTSGCPPPDTDQRGVSRPQGPRCDIGSFEATSLILPARWLSNQRPRLRGREPG
jgi:hypothetical protein